jgi:branched-chain amino acid transport system substrate-binding protein
MRSKRIRIAAAVVVMALATSATARAQSGPIELGALYHTSRPQAVFDEPSHNGARLAVETINADGGVLGRNLALVVGEGQSVAGAWGRTVPSLIAANPDVVVLFGLSDSDNALAAGEAAAREKRVFVTSGATSPRLPQQVPAFLFMAAFGDNVQAAAAAEWAYGSLGARRALVLYDPHRIYTTLLEGYFATHFEGLGGTVTAVEAIEPRSVDPSVPDLGDVDIVFLSAETAEDAARMIPLVRSAGFAGPIIGGDGYDAPAVWSLHPDVASVYFTTHVYLGRDNPDPLVVRFMDAYASAVPRQGPTGFSALAYDTVGLLTAALANAGAAEPAAVAAGLNAISDYEGVTGTISFAGGNRVPRKSVTILSIEDGAQSFVAEVTPESVPAP